MCPLSEYILFPIYTIIMTLSPPSIASTARHTHPPPVPVVPADERWADFNVDRLILRLAPFLPQQSLLHHLPRGISHFLGFRLPTPRPAQHPLPDMIIWTLAAAGAFVGISSVAGITQLLKLESHVVGSMVHPLPPSLPSRLIKPRAQQRYCSSSPPSRPSPSRGTFSSHSCLHQ